MKEQQIKEQRKNILKLEFIKIFDTVEYYASSEYPCGFSQRDVIESHKFSREIELDYFEISRDYLCIIFNGKKIETNNTITDLQQKLIDNNLIDELNSDDTRLSNFCIEFER